MSRWTQADSSIVSPKDHISNGNGIKRKFDAMKKHDGFILALRGRGFATMLSRYLVGKIIGSIAVPFLTVLLIKLAVDYGMTF
jgi:hypothetical protein